VGELSDILRQLEPSLGPVGGEPAPLEGGITNRNFRVRFAQDEYVVRLHGKDTDLLGISRDAERVASDAAAALGIAPAVAASFEGGMVTCFVTCASLDAAQVAANAEEIARALRAFHDCGAVLPVAFIVPALLADYEASMLARGEQAGEAYAEILAAAALVADALGPVTLRPCHNDLLAGNVIRRHPDGKIMLVDWEYAGMGDPYFDLGNLSVNNDFDEPTERRLLAAYHGAEASDAQLARLRLMRVMSDAREAAWGVMQGLVSELDFDFRGYAGEHLERLRRAVASDDFTRWTALAKEGI
jgi:thiamine kinase-like enzyme